MLDTPRIDPSKHDVTSHINVVSCGVKTGIHWDSMEMSLFAPSYTSASMSGQDSISAVMGQSASRDCYQVMRLKSV